MNGLGHHQYEHQPEPFSAHTVVVSDDICYGRFKLDVSKMEGNKRKRLTSLAIAICKVSYQEGGFGRVCWRREKMIEEQYS
jgi:hypothetical protein